jgi:hypothetical protein
VPAGAVLVVQTGQHRRDHLGPGQVRGEVVGHLAAERRGPPPEHRLDVLRGQRVVRDHGLALHPDRVQHENQQHARPVLARRAVHERRARVGVAAGSGTARDVGAGRTR